MNFITQNYEKYMGKVHKNMDNNIEALSRAVTNF